MGTDYSQYLGDLCKKMLYVQNDIEKLLQAQNINNLLLLSNNMMVPEDTRRDALNQAMTLMGLSETKVQEQFIDSLPTDVFGR